MKDVKEKFGEFLDKNWIYLFLFAGLIWAFFSERKEIQKLRELAIKYKCIKKWLHYIKEVSKEYDIHPAFVAAILYQESKGDPNLVSKTGAIGLMQVMPSTAKKICGYPKKLLYDPYYNIKCGTKYLARLYKKFKDYALVAAKYYGGPDAKPTDTYGSPPVYKYVRNVLKHFAILRELV